MHVYCQICAQFDPAGKYLIIYLYMCVCVMHACAQSPRGCMHRRKKIDRFSMYSDQVLEEVPNFIYLGSSVNRVECVCVCEYVCMYVCVHGFFSLYMCLSVYKM